MAKRYHQSKKDRMHESRGMDTAHDRAVDRRNLMHARRSKMHHSHNADKFNDEHHHDQDFKSGDVGFDPRMAMRANMNEFYAGMGPRRRQELEDAGMIHEDYNSIANLPQEVMMKPYPMTGPYLPEGLDDTIRGVDYQMDYDDEQRSSHFYPKKV